jgi:hypothetical protein
MQSGNPFPLVLIQQVEVLSMIEAERFMHKKLKSYQIVREWFSLPSLDPWLQVLGCRKMKRWIILV